ncbi:hypothetical protein DC094_05400 [Pelagibaculum spongiae]|uniref:Uncharacterized protein n=1 Tax=Pelagibaculum spongiae TaxID=2080658 RepID=A0A2V1GZE2_9GAMM|nr:hypothetical protein DC094_05400 [Pelagibaculum spongiae]
MVLNQVCSVVGCMILLTSGLEGCFCRPYNKGRNKNHRKSHQQSLKQHATLQARTGTNLIVCFAVIGMCNRQSKISFNSALC